MAKWVKPVPGGITTPYGKRGRSWSSGRHTGADFAQPTGTPIKAVAAGRVKSVGQAGAYGIRTVITIAPGEEVWYCHQSRTAVTKGQQVAAGAVIGYVGSTGNTTGPHLHLELRINGAHQNPAPRLAGAVSAPSAADQAAAAETPTNVAATAGAASGDDAFKAVRSMAIALTVVVGGLGLMVLGGARMTAPIRAKGETVASAAHPAAAAAVAAKRGLQR